MANVAALLAAFGGSASPFSPSQLANLEAWWRFNQGITVTGSGVSQWNDQTLNARHLLQATDAARPPLQGDGTILFNGTSHFLKTGAFTLNQPCTIYLRARQVTWTNADRFFDGNTATSVLCRTNTATPTIALFAGATVADNGNLAVNTYGSMAFVFNGAGSMIQVNNTAPTTGNAGANNAAGFTLAAAGDGLSAWANLQVKEGLIYSAAHDQATRDKMIAYLNTL